MSMSRTFLTHTQKNDIRRLHQTGNYSKEQLIEMYDSSERNIRRICNAPADFPDDLDADTEIVESNVTLAKHNQKLLDRQRIERKSFREYARIENAVSEYCKELSDVFHTNNLSDLTTYHDDTGNVVGMIQISDIHFNEQINLDCNKYNFTVAAQRFRKLSERAKAMFGALGVTHVLVACTGDLMNSDRRLDELMENATNRSQATFIAVDIMQQFLLDLNGRFNVTMASITGNEGRVNKDLGWVDQMATDNYDLMIHNILKYLFDGSAGVTVLDVVDPLEQVINLNGQNILMVHGHNGVSNTAKMEQKVSAIKSRYASQGVKIDYVITGHIHSAYISDCFARSSGMPGANAYSEKALNLESRSSQNIYIVYPDGIDGVRIDLQHVDEIEPYSYNRNLEAYHSTSAHKLRSQNNVVIHQIVV